MAKISEKSRLYRTKEQMCIDVAKVLASDLAYGTKQSVVDHVLWVWSEFDGKIQGCKHWSIKAKNAKTGTRLIHEHVVPRKVLREKLFSITSPTKRKVCNILSKYCVGVVVTNDEDKELNSLGLRATMPKDWDGKDIWARYSVAKIKIA